MLSFGLSSDCDLIHNFLKVTEGLAQKADAVFIFVAFAIIFFMPKELSLVTAIVSRAAIIDIRADASDAAGFELAGILSRVQKQMISLMSQFQLSPELLTSLEENRPGALITPSSMTGAAPANLLLVLKVGRPKPLIEM